MCDPVTAIMAGSAILGGVSSYGQAKAQKRAYQYQAGIDEQNAQYNELQAQDVLARGEQLAKQQRSKGRQLEGTQRAAMAASGIRLDSGTALNILSDTEDMTAYDAQVIRQNAEREAYGHRMQGFNNRARASAASTAARNTDPLMAGVSSLLTGAGSVASSWYRNSQAGV